MEKKLRRIRLDFDPKENMEFISGRIAGTLGVGSNTEPDSEYAIDPAFTDDGRRTEYFRCDATDEEWENIKKYLFYGKIYRRLVTVVEE